MPPIRGCGSWPVVFIILALFFVNAVHSANVTAPSCKTKVNSTLKITVIPDPHRVRRADKPLSGNPSNIAPRCKARFNSTVSAANATAPKVGRIRRADKPPGAQLPGGQSPAGQPPGGQSPGAQSPGGSSVASSVYDAQVSDGEDWPARPNSPGKLAQEPESDEEVTADIDYDAYVDAGASIEPPLGYSDDEVITALTASGHFDPGQKLASPFTDVSAFKRNGWNMEDLTPDLLKDFNSKAAFGTALRSLGISDKARPEGKHEYTEYEHTLPYEIVDGVEEKPVGALARFGFVTDPQDACLIISVAYSTEYWIIEKDLDRLFGTESPPLSHQSDMVFLDWKHACTKHKANPDTLKHIFFSVITTPETKEVVQNIYGAKMGHELESMGDIPLWDQRITLESGTDEFRALSTTVQVTGIMWMLLQHREELGKKIIKKMCIFKDELTGVVPGHEPWDRGPSVYIELEDAQLGGVQPGGVQSGSVKSGDGKSSGNRRADNSPGSASEESGSSQSDESEGSSGSLLPQSAALPPLNAVHLAPYIRQGEVAAAYMRASDEEITADLVSKGIFKTGQKLASPFTDHSAFKSNGWEEKNGLDDIQGQSFAWVVPFVNALQSLRISDKPRPEGKHEHFIYDHTLPWMRNGQSMKPVGEDATFQYVTDAPDACIIITMTYSTQHKIREKSLTGFENPPLSYSSDMTFLEWKRACEKHKADPKPLKHLFISVVLTPTTQDIVASILKNQGKPITDRADVWGNQLPKWEEKLTFLPDSDDGKALHGTVQLKGIMWMLIQHREHLGKKAVKSISLFRGALPGAAGPDFETEVHGPTFYIELEDVV